MENINNNIRWLSIADVQKNKSILNDIKTIRAILVFEDEYSIGVSPETQKYINTIVRIYINGQFALEDYLILSNEYPIVKIIDADNLNNLLKKINHENTSINSRSYSNNCGYNDVDVFSCRSL